MTEIPNLNKRNTRYGNKKFLGAWRNSLAYLQDYGRRDYNDGGYSQVINTGIERLDSTFKSAQKKGLEEAFSNIDEADIVWFYLVGMSYHHIGKIDEAIVFLKIVASQHGFEKYMLSDFRDYPSKALFKLEALAEKHGESYVNDVDVADYIANLNLKGGCLSCFIATAAYGDYEHANVRILRYLRDNYLLKSKTGNRIVNAYYFISPPIADLMARNSIIRWLVRVAFVQPIVSISRRLLSLKRRKKEADPNSF